MNLLPKWYCIYVNKHSAWHYQDLKKVVTSDVKTSTEGEVPVMPDMFQ